MDEEKNAKEGDKKQELWNNLKRHIEKAQECLQPLCPNYVHIAKDHIRWALENIAELEKLCS